MVTIDWNQTQTKTLPAHMELLRPIRHLQSTQLFEKCGLWLFFYYSTFQAKYLNTIYHALHNRQGKALPPEAISFIHHKETHHGRTAKLFYNPFV